MKKAIKNLLIPFCAVVYIFSIMCNYLSPVKSIAAVKSKGTYVEDGYYRIYHPESNKYVDVSEVSKKNGAIVHIWDKAKGYQNQIFKLTRNENGSYTIIANHSKKAIEVRNSSCDDYGEVAQWDYAGIPCQQWYINMNSDGTVSFSNANSGLNLNVKWNYKNNGTPLIQYHSDGTAAEKFKLIKLSEKDILAAVWTTDISNIATDSISISSADVSTSNYRYQNGLKIYFPSTTKKSMSKVYYISSDTLVDIICDEAMKDTLKKKIYKKSYDEGKDQISNYLIKKLDAPGLEKIYIVADFLYDILSSSKDEEWNNFISFARPLIKEKKGMYIQEYVNSKKVTTYGASIGCREVYCFYDLYSDQYTYNYSKWNGNSIEKINLKGNWEFTYM